MQCVQCLCTDCKCPRIIQSLTVVQVLLKACLSERPHPNARVLAKMTQGTLHKIVENTVTQDLGRKELAVEVTMKSDYWHCKEGIATREYRSMLAFLELLTTPYDYCLTRNYGYLRH